jgi:hypothetical protein
MGRQRGVHDVEEESSHTASPCVSVDRAVQASLSVDEQRDDTHREDREDDGQSA